MFESRCFSLSLSSSLFPATYLPFPLKKLKKDSTKCFNFLKKRTFFFSPPLFLSLSLFGVVEWGLLG
jgi:hypothetical protein